MSAVRDRTRIEELEAQLAAQLKEEIGEAKERAAAKAKAEAEALQVGDVVRLKGQLVAMTVIELRTATQPLPNQITVVWLDSNNEERRGAYPVAALERQ